MEISDKKTEINGLTSSIASEYSALCAGDLENPNKWIDLQAKLDDIDAKALSIEGTSILALNDDLGDIVSSNKSYGFPCGAGSAVIPEDISAVYSDKMEIFNKVAAGNMFDSSITLLSDSSGLSCDDLNTYLDTTISDFDFNISYLSNMNGNLSIFSGFNEEVIGLLGTIGLFTGCGDEMFDSFEGASSWLPEVNPEFNSGFQSVKSAKETGGTAADVYNNSIQNINTEQDWDARLTTIKSDFSTLNSNFPSS